MFVVPTVAFSSRTYAAGANSCFINKHLGGKIGCILNKPLCWRYATLVVHPYVGGTSLCWRHNSKLEVQPYAGGTDATDPYSVRVRVTVLVLWFVLLRFLVLCFVYFVVVLNVWFTTNGMCAKNNTHIMYVALTRVIAVHGIYCCLLPQWSFAHIPLAISDRNSIFLPSLLHSHVLLFNYRWQTNKISNMKAVATGPQMVL